MRAALVLILLGMAFAFWLGIYAFTPGPERPEPGQLVQIPATLPFPAIQKILADSGVIYPDRRFSLLARLMLVTTGLRAGEYSFPVPVPPYRVLRDLYRGSKLQHPLTIPEGSNLKQIAAILARDGWTTEDAFLAAAGDQNFIRELGLTVPTLEGYLFPDTYLFERGNSDPRTIIRAMVEQTEKVLAETGARKGLPQYGLDAHGILTLASIVEKETGLGLERPMIARVFLNRLQHGMRLQTDPTVIYGIANFNGNLTRKDLQTPNPYNTYLLAGLPPGPIASPGLAAIQAVMAPAPGDFYYFVSKNDGSHYFSRTLDEHNRAVNRYQKQAPGPLNEEVQVEELEKNGAEQSGIFPDRNHDRHDYHRSFGLPGGPQVVRPVGQGQAEDRQGPDRNADG